MKGLLFTYLITGSGAVGGLIQPFYGFLAYICFAIIRPQYLWFWSVPQANYSRIIAVATIVGWLMRGFGDWRLGRSAPIVWAFLGFFGWATLCGALVGFDQYAVDYLDIQFKMLLPFLIGLTTIDSARRLKQAAWTMVGSLGYLALEFNRSYFAGYNMVREDGFGSMDNNCVAIEMVTGAGAAVFLAMRSERWWQKMLAFGAAILMAHTVMFSFSRGGFLGLLLMTSIAFLLVPKQPKHYLMFAALVAIGIRLAGPQVLERFQTTFADNEVRDGSAAGRLELWKACGDVMRRQPLFGVGPNHFPLVAPEYGFWRGKEAHSLWLQTGAELGIIGMGLLLSFYSSTILLAWRLAMAADSVDPWLRDVARMVVAALAGFVVSASFVTINRLEFPPYIVLLGAAALRLQSVAPSRDQRLSRTAVLAFPLSRNRASSTAT